MKNLLIAFVISFMFMPSAHANLNVTDLALMPPYCLGTQGIRKISHDPKPIEEYEAIYGNSYHHLHHYCGALVGVHKAQFLEDKLLRLSKLRYALTDIQYSLDRSGPKFVFLPDMYTSKARVLFMLHRDGEAVIALKKAIEAKPDYVPAIARLSDYFADTGDKAQAIKILEEGIGNTERAKTLIRKLEKLGKTYQGTPGSARKKEDDGTPLEADVNQVQEKPSTATSNADTPATPDATKNQTSPPDNRPADNPYCRFCP
jgi:tetratricopeptide (TPR) repeat protein